MGALGFIQFSEAIFGTAQKEVQGNNCSDILTQFVLSNLMCVIHVNF